VARFGRVDIWINNAGVGHRTVPVVELTADEVAGVVAINVTGTLHGCTVAMTGMAAQDGGGAVWNMEGLGSDGRWVAGTTIYGASKYAVRYLTRALAREAEGGPVRVGAISPGMVVTDLLMRGVREASPEDRARTLKIFNILADRPETVTPWLARRVLASQGNGTRIAWLTTPKIAARFLLSPFRSRDLFDDAGE
jgi:NAD(P)-dependent dehydrogenase (short-subunit alcohol dehydrogenase family)